MRHNKRLIKSAFSQSTFHLADKEDCLWLYLPRNINDLDICLELDLPKRICLFLGITDANANNIIGSIYRTHNLTSIARALQWAGVREINYNFAELDKKLAVDAAEPLQAEVPRREQPKQEFEQGTPEVEKSGVDRSNLETADAAESEHEEPGVEESEAESLEAESGSETLVGDVGNARLAGSNVRMYRPTTQAPFIDTQPSDRNEESNQERSILNSSRQVWQKATHDEAYKLVLEHVATAARGRARLRKMGLSGILSRCSPTIEPLSAAVLQEAFLGRTQERDFRLGAAGELYMFEFLKEVDLPGFGWHNWKSQIRSRVASHPSYHDIRGCNDRNAIADIEFEDASGNFTRLLRQTGCLAASMETIDRPFYHIEVKTTTSSNYKEPFYMSKAQELHVRQVENTGICSKIYVICRIFNLGQGDGTGLHLYVDPETKRRNGDLDFTPHTWAVTPSRFPLTTI